MWPETLVTPISSLLHSVPYQEMTILFCCLRWLPASLFHIQYPIHQQMLLAVPLKHVQNPTTSLCPKARTFIQLTIISSLDHCRSHLPWPALTLCVYCWHRKWRGFFKGQLDHVGLLLQTLWWLPFSLREAKSFTLVPRARWHSLCLPLPHPSHLPQLILSHLPQSVAVTLAFLPVCKHTKHSPTGEKVLFSGAPCPTFACCGPVQMSFY